MNGPTAAPNRWPYREHRTVEEVDALTPRNGRPSSEFDRAGRQIIDPKHMAAASAVFLAALLRELAA